MSYTRTGIKGLSALGSALLVATAPAIAAGPDADARIKELERKLERSLLMIESLQNEVQEMKSNKPAPAPAVQVVANAEQSAKIENLEKQVAQLGTGLATRSSSADGLPVHGFADVGLRHSGENNPVFGRGSKGFNVGSFDLYLTPQFGNNVRSLVELVFEVDGNGGVATDLERLQVGYAFGDSLTTWLGRFHTPYGYWNTAYHHGAQIQTSVLRPRFLDFEDKGGILPAHTTGAWATGAFNLASAKLGYDAYVGNAQHINDEGVLDMKMGGSNKFRASGGYNLWYSPKSLSALRLGVHGQGGNIEDDTSHNITRLNMYGGYGVFINDDWEALAEYYRFNNKDQSTGSGSHRSTAWFAQLGYNIGQFTPYGRIEKTRLDQGDAYFALQAGGRSYNRTAFGMRYDVDPKSALKLELNHTLKKDLGVGVVDDSYNEAQIQYSIRF